MLAQHFGLVKFLSPKTPSTVTVTVPFQTKVGQRSQLTVMMTMRVGIHFPLENQLRTMMI